MTKIFENTGLSRDAELSAQNLAARGSITVERIDSPEDTRFQTTIVIKVTGEEHNGISWQLMDMFNYPNSIGIGKHVYLGLNKRYPEKYGIQHNYRGNFGIDAGFKNAVEDQKVSVAYTHSQPSEWIEFRFIFA
jgi:hypothetical protein